MPTLPSIKTYSVHVDGFSSILFSARTRSKAMSIAYRAYLGYDDRCTFRRFLEIAAVYRAPDPHGVGKRVTIRNEPATVVIPAGGYDGMHPLQPAFMRDDSHTIFRAHESEVVCS
jgi:hypothetical protein